MRFDFTKYSLLAGLVCVLAAAAGAYQLQQYSHPELARATLRNARIVLAPGEFVFHASDPGRNGALRNIQDANPDSAAIIPYPARHPQGTWFLIDTALSHWPPTSASNTSPRPRRPVAIVINNGVCSTCSRGEFTEYGRIRRARIEILARRANNPDYDFKHERYNTLLNFIQDFPDRSGPVRIALPLPAAAASSKYPKNVFFLACKITVLDIYPGAKFGDRVAMAEFTYVDEPDPALRKSGAEHIWK